MELNTYLHFDAQCREAFETYARVLGGKVELLMTYGEAPMGGRECPPAERDKIIHVRLVAGDPVLMGSDSPPGHAAPLSGFSILREVAGGRWQVAGGRRQAAGKTDSE